MSEFIILQRHPRADSATADDTFRRMCTHIQRIPRSASHPQLATFADGRIRIARLTTRDTAACGSVQGGRSWAFAHGPVSYRGLRLTSELLDEVLQRIAANPASLARDLDGNFVAVAWNAEKKRLSVIPAAIGMSPVHLRVTPDGCVGISSSAAALACMGPVTLDSFTFQTLYRCGHRLPPHTLYQEIHSLPEGSLIELSADGYEIQPYWIPDLDYRAHGTIGDCSEAIAYHLERYCGTLVEPETTVFSDLTGGYDSRVTTAALVRGRIPFTATVAGSARHPDVIQSQRICEAEHFPHIAVDPIPNPETIAEEVQSALLLSEGCIDAFTFAATLRVKRTLLGIASHVPVTTVSGALGEMYRDFYWSQEYFHRGARRNASLDKLIRYRIDATPAQMDLFAEDWRPAWRRELHAYLQKLIEPFEGERNTSQIDIIYLRKMAGMIGGFAAAAGRLSIPLTPFGALAALQIAVSVPPEWRYDARLLRSVAWALSPSLAGHMTLSGRPCAPANLTNWYRYWPKYGLTAQRVIRKLSTVWMGRTIFPEYSEPAPTVNPYAKFLEEESRPGGRLHYDSMHTACWFDPAGYQSLLQRAKAPDGFGLCNLISRVYTCEAMLRTASALRSESLAPMVAAS